MGWLLLAAVGLPLAGAPVSALLGRRPAAPRWPALVTSLGSLALSVAAALTFRGGQPGMQLVSRLNWIPALGIRLHLGVDGISLPLLLMTAFLAATTVLASWGVRRRSGEYFFWLQLLSVGMLGVFTALDLFVFFFFFELALIPMYFLIGLWGGPRKDYAAMKFLLYTGLGSIVMFLAFLVLRFYGGTFDLLTLEHTRFPVPVQLAVFAALFLAWAVKTPVVPLHTWLPDAHVEAPTPASMLLAGVLLKMGTYGLLRISLGIFPALFHAFAPVLAVLAVVNILYGALLAMAQTDLKGLVAYASISSMGYILLGEAAGTGLALEGAVLQMVAHGLVAALLFLAAGDIHELAGTRAIPALGGLLTRAPTLDWLSLLGALCYLGLPGLAVFAAEFPIFLGSFAAFPTYTVLAAAGIVLTAGYLLWTAQRILFGPGREAALLPALGGMRLLPLALLAASLVAVGVYPTVWYHLIGPAVHLLAWGGGAR